MINDVVGETVARTRTLDSYTTGWSTIGTSGKGSPGQKQDLYERDAVVHVNWSKLQSPQIRGLNGLNKIWTAQNVKTYWLNAKDRAGRLLVHLIARDPPNEVE